MFRTYQVLFNRLLLLFDICILFISFVTAWYIKFYSGLLAASQSLTFREFMVIVFFGTLVFLFTNHLAGLYKPMRTQSIRSELIAIVKSAALGLLIFMSALYFIKLVHFSRDVLAIFLALFIVLTLAERLLVRSVLRSLRARGFNQKFILIIGRSSAVNRFIQGLEQHPWFGYRILGYLSSKEDDVSSNVSLPHIGGVADLEKMLTQHVIDHVVIALPRTMSTTVVEVTRLCDLQGIQSLILPDYFDLLPARPRFENFAGMPLIDTRYVPLDDALNAFLKRAFDIVFSLVVLIALSPFLALIAITVKLTSKGPVFYVQERVGKSRRMFKMYKFRSMKVELCDVGENAALDVGWSRPNDSRRTKFGAFLRRTSIDELPQFWNVLIGDMSVIGPRPERPYYVELFKDEIPRYMVKHRVRPGITGWAQVNGWRGDTSIRERVKFDIEYIENWSFGMDLRIVWKTVLEGFIHPNAY